MRRHWCGGGGGPPPRAPGRRPAPARRRGAAELRGATDKARRRGRSGAAVGRLDGHTRCGDTGAAAATGRCAAAVEARRRGRSSSRSSDGARVAAHGGDQARVGGGAFGSRSGWETARNRDFRGWQADSARR
ncbi:hypothetical protein ACP4OV_011131 [Aristida adscensionis]